jgi:ABC-type Mn2+/Zn2+ transport system ATPase subunit
MQILGRGIRMSGNFAPAVEMKNVTKRYNELVAVNNLNLTIRQGEIFGLLGPNGSGKSTTLKMLLGLVQPTEGSVMVLGIDAQKDAVAVKRVVGYAPEAPASTSSSQASNSSTSSATSTACKPKRNAAASPSTSRRCSWKAAKAT